MEPEQLTIKDIDNDVAVMSRMREFFATHNEGKVLVIKKADPKSP